jgi:hypothetical protein
LTPHAIQGDVIVPFDQGERENCKPVTVRMKPCTVTKRGRKRTHTPDASQLKDLGLRVAADQPHLEARRFPSVRKPEPQSPPESRLESASVAEQELVDHWHPSPHERNPWAGGPIEPAPPKRAARVARAKVSAVKRGAIPVTLGGKLPPVSVLARREFGLRALRR